ncbi:MAG: hypothetical protein CL681_18535 [Blastopirellula sp.]|nr:hypothetical protein [Blastopirellula sp.]
MLIFVMSVGFLFLSLTVFATHRNWRAEVMRPEAANGQPKGLKFQIQDQQEINENLRNELEASKRTLAAEKAARRAVIATLAKKVKELEAELTTQIADFQALQATNNTNANTLQQKTQYLANLTTEVEGLRQEIRDAQQERDEKVETVVALTDKVNSSNGQARQLAERRGQLLAQVTQLKQVMDAHGIRLTESPDLQAPPVDGFVTAVGSKDLVEISLGSDDGMRRGHRLEVYRDNKYLGSVIIQDTRPDRSVASIVANIRKGTIKVNDRVTTTL